MTDIIFELWLNKQVNKIQVGETDAITADKVTANLSCLKID